MGFASLADAELGLDGFTTAAPDSPALDAFGPDAMAAFGVAQMADLMSGFQAGFLAADPFADQAIGFTDLTGAHTLDGLYGTEFGWTSPQLGLDAMNLLGPDWSALSGLQAQYAQLQDRNPWSPQEMKQDMLTAGDNLRSPAPNANYPGSTTEGGYNFGEFGRAVGTAGGTAAGGPVGGFLGGFGGRAIGRNIGERLDPPQPPEATQMPYGPGGVEFVTPR